VQRGANFWQHFVLFTDIPNFRQRRRFPRSNVSECIFAATWWFESMANRRETIFVGAVVRANAII